jgi:hypothetical protein
MEETMTKKQLNEVREYILTTATKRRNGGVMAGKLKKDKTPDLTLRGSEMEFFMGAYTCLTKMMSILDKITLDEAMRYFLPSVMFAIMRDESVIDNLTEDKEKYQ